MQGRQECTQLVRPRQGFSADRPTLLGIVARLCLAGGNLGKQRDKVLPLQEGQSSAENTFDAI